MTWLQTLGQNVFLYTYKMLWYDLSKNICKMFKLFVFFLFFFSFLFSFSDKNKKSILKNLLDDVPVPVNATSSSISLPLKTQCTPRIMKNRYENEICKNTLVTVIHLKENEALSVQTKSTSHIQKPKVSKKPLKKRKLLCNSSTSVKGASASSEIKITSAIDKEKQTLVEQDEIPKVIPSTSKMVKPGTSSLLTVEENSVTNLHSISAMQQEPTILVLPSIEVVQQGKDCTIVGQIPNRDIAQEMFSSSNTNQAPRKSNILSNASKLLQVPIRGSVLPIPNSGKVIEGQDGKLPSGTAVPQKPDTDSTFLGNNSSLVSKETNESGITVQKKSILVSPFQNLSRSAILQKTDSTSQTSNKIVHQDANGGTIKKKPLVSILCKPVIDTVQQETSSAKNSQMTNSGLVCQGSGSSASVQTSIKGIVHQKTSNPKIFKVTNSGLVCQGSGRSTSAQTSNKGTVHQESSSAKIFKVTNSGLVCQGSGISSSVQTPNRGTVNQETSSAKVFQVTNSGLVSQASSTSTSLKTLCKDTVQKEASNVKPSQTKARIITEQVSGEARPLQVPNKKLDEQIPGISAKNYLPKSFEHNQKRKLFSAEFEMSSKKNIKHCKLSTDQSINSKSSDSVPEAVNGAYKPSISWLNPMNIPSSLVNLNKTKQRITK